MENRKWIIIVNLLVLVIAGVLFLLLKNDKEILVSDEYLVKFSGGSGEMVFNTYVYETNSKKYKYKYVLTTETTKSWGSTEWEETVNKEGFAKSMDEVVSIAKDHGCGYAAMEAERWSMDEYLDNFNK